MTHLTSNEQTLVERLRDCVKVTFSAGLHGVESDCREAADELDRQRAEIERLTRERDESERALEALQNRWASRPLSNPDLIAENCRLRAALERIASREADAREIVEQNRWPSTLAIDLAGIARLALSGEPSSHETKAKPEALTRSEVVVEILDVIDDLIKPGDLNGNGTDETAYRNGLVTAYNVISAQFGEFAQKAKGDEA